jgi:predicted TIM-barrel fold metal-dependent hydrolase
LYESEIFLWYSGGNVYKIVNVHGHLHKSRDVKEMIEDMKRSGVVKFCALALGKQWEPHGYFNNEETISVMKQYPDIVVAMGHIELGGPYMDSPEKVEILKEKGCSGLKFISPGAPYNSEIYFPFYERAERYGMPILFHTGIVSVQPDDRKFGVNAEYMRPFYLDRVARCFPNLKIILGHPGEPYFQEALTLTEFYPNIYLCPAGGSGSDFHISKIKTGLNPFLGADMNNPDENVAKFYFRKFVFGTDNPPASVWYSQSIRLMDYFQIDDETRHLYFYKNAERIFNWQL